MTSSPHDAIFKAAFENPQHAEGLLRAILPAPLVDAIQWPTMAREPGSFVDPQLAERHSDLLFSAKVRGGRAFVYVLLEHQSATDPDMPLRMLVYQVRIWERFRKQDPGPLPPIIPVVVSHAPGGWTAPVTFGEMFNPPPSSIPGLAELVPQFTLLVEDLAHVSNDALKARALAAFPKLVLWALRDARDTKQLLANLGHWGLAFREALRTPHGMEALGLLMRYIALVSDDLHLEQFRAKLREQAPEAEDAAVTIAEQMRQLGKAEGRAEGKAEGKAETLLKLLVLKFGAVSNKHQERIANATAEQLDRYVERVLTADNVEAVFA